MWVSADRLRKSVHVERWNKPICRSSQYPEQADHTAHILHIRSHFSTLLSHSARLLNHQVPNAPALLERLLR